MGVIGWGTGGVGESLEEWWNLTTRRESCPTVGHRANARDPGSSVDGLSQSASFLSDFWRQASVVSTALKVKQWIPTMPNSSARPDSGATNLLGL